MGSMLPNLTGRTVWLGSASPRRQEILAKLGFPFAVRPSTFAEDLDKSTYAGRPADYALDNALIKADHVWQEANRLPAAERPDVVIGCDTVVAVDDVILEKPADVDDARRMLKMLSGRQHQVHSGVAVLCSSSDATVTSPVQHQFQQCTSVRFSPLDDEDVDRYLATGESMDKAGAYGIQGQAGALIEAIDGDYYNVMGLPLNKLYLLLKSL